ncbi:Tim44/TimA family putative adaptor protein [Tanticharoenia sakaeratensis]|uniref:Mitochondrial import inner membrane translocase subunit Tim44 n=1 Tax=Tanticharoenia sakaeratensis NBRC 103193 TaxID=1231623 RepID=A0A0D6MJT0_9PROT|nr:Tim44/TimA family putative adaptor protein [Tanticharoenia sakaeratensis]GAN53914.1 mitochondrial import inner membrane translocase subunit Tim44 [Tanticharoenia sakaeratensis NBRC 103193]GBQ25249.1 mitochondrial import inner membrane translocase subunit Tim44 [Tanticharoenia sakaeratensis NBRC 103193]
MTDMLHNFPIDIVVFAGIAVALGWRLRTVLGRRGGAQPVVAIRSMPVDARPRPQPVRPALESQPDPAFEIPTPSTRIGQVLTEIGKLDRHFDASTFLREAAGTFRTVVVAFAQGDRDRLRRFLTNDAYAAFDSAISAREAAGETQRSEIRGILSMAIDDAALSRPAAEDSRALPVATVDVRIVSQQISLLNGADNQPVSGTDAVTEFSDLWRFERLTGPDAPESLWRLASARAA